MTQNYTDTPNNGNEYQEVYQSYIDAVYCDVGFMPITDESILRQAMQQADSPTTRLDSKFFLVFEWMTDERGLGLSNLYEREVYAYLYINRQNAMKPGIINQKKIAEDLRISVNSVNRAISALVDKGYLDKRPVKVEQARGGAIRGSNVYEVLQEPINQAILNTAPVCSESLSETEEFYIDTDGNVTRTAKTANTDQTDSVTKPQDSPDHLRGVTVENAAVEKSKPQDSPDHLRGVTVVSNRPPTPERGNGANCGNVEYKNASNEATTCANAKNAQDSSLIDSPYRTEVEEEVEVGKIYRSGRVTARIQPVDVTGVVDGVGTQIPTGEVGMSSGVAPEASRSMPSPAAAAKGGAGNGSQVQQAADAVLPDVSALGLSSADLKAVDAIVATSRKPSAKQAESVARTKIAFHERLMDGWTPMQLICAFKVYVRDTYKDVRPGTPEERERSRYEKFPANWLASDSEVAMWDQAAGGNGTPAGSPTRAARAGYVSQQEAMSAPACGNGTDKHGNPTVDGHPVRVKKIAGIWEYYDSYNSWAYLDDLGNLTEEQALVRAAEKLRFELAKPDSVQAGEIAQGRSRLHARTRELPSLTEKFARDDGIGKVV